MYKKVNANNLSFWPFHSESSQSLQSNTYDLAQQIHVEIALRKKNQEAQASYINNDSRNNFNGGAYKKTLLYSRRNYKKAGINNKKMRLAIKVVGQQSQSRNKSKPKDQRILFHNSILSALRLKKSIWKNTKLHLR